MGKGVCLLEEQWAWASISAMLDFRVMSLGRSFLQSFIVAENDLDNEMTSKWVTSQHVGKI